MINFETINWIAWGGLLFGLVARVFLPYLVMHYDNPELAWEWKYFYQQLLGFGIIVLVLPLVLDNLPGVNDLAFQVAFIAGWGSADIGREFARGAGEVLAAVRQ